MRKNDFSLPAGFSRWTSATEWQPSWCSPKRSRLVEMRCQQKSSTWFPERDAAEICQGKILTNPAMNLQVVVQVCGFVFGRFGCADFTRGPSRKTRQHSWRCTETCAANVGLSCVYTTCTSTSEPSRRHFIPPKTTRPCFRTERFQRQNLDGKCWPDQNLPTSGIQNNREPLYVKKIRAKTRSRLRAAQFACVRNLPRASVYTQRATYKMRIQFCTCLLVAAEQRQCSSLSRGSL